jgi:predicted outer membrane repeat protein
MGVTVRRGIQLVVSGATALCLLSPAAAQATTFDVTNANDSGDGSLRQAILDANAADGADDIDATGVTGTINVQSALPSLSEAVDIAGPGPDQLTVRRDTGGEYRIFDIAGGVVSTISGLTIANGSVEGNGGGIFNFGTLTLQDAVVTGNHAGGGGGGIYTDSDNNFQGSLAIQDSAVTHNDANGDGGGLYHTRGVSLSVFEVQDSVVASNHADGNGGGIYLPTFDAVTLVSSEVRENSADGSGGGIGCAGGLVKASQSTISSNTAKGGGGIGGCAVDLSDTTVALNSATGGGSGGIGSTFNSTIEDSLITGNTATGDGGGIAAVDGDTVITDSEVSNNSAGGFGGGIDAGFIAGVTTRNVIVSGNTAVKGGGGINVVQAANINATTISGNAATGINADGGGIRDADITRVSNSTIAENTATGDGGGIWSRSNPCCFKLANNTIARNAASRGSNLFQEVPRGELTSTILADPLGDPHNCAYEFAFDRDIQGYNLADDTSCGLDQPGDQAGVDALLGPLGDNGGLTETMMPASASPAIDHGFADELTVDQRGEPRPQDLPGFPNPVGGDGADVGAVELQPSEIDAITPTTRITKHKRKRIGSNGGRVLLKLRFRGQDNDSPSSRLSFECQLDKKPRRQCASPFKRKVGPGSHEMLIWAIDAVGNTDPTAAHYRFKVKH